ncbi:MAG: hypothetical protein AB7O91_06685 [Sphingomonas sp.]
MIGRITAIAATFALSVALPALPVQAQQIRNGGTPVPAGSPQRRAILDAVRPPIERALGGPVEFVVRTLRVQAGWALVIADPQRPGGGRIDPRRYFSADDLEGMDGLTVNAIVRLSGGRWRLVDHAIGPSDVWYCGVDGPPRALTGC